MGLRAQIIAALTVAFGLALLLLGTLTVQLTARARDLQLDQLTSLTAASVLAAVGAADDWEQVAAPLIDHQWVNGIEIREQGRTARFGERQGISRTSEVEAGSGITLWLDEEMVAERSTAELFLLYVAVTAAFVLLLAYVALTYLIVRPISLLTRASERLAEGGVARVPVKGPAEIVRLAVAFNHMEEQLREERAALTKQLAELTKTASELETAQDQVLRGERLASVGRLAAGVAHEIGNPLAAILGLVDLLRDGGLTDDQQADFLGRIHRETDRIHRTIGDLLDFSRPAPNEERGDVVAAVEDSIGLVSPQAELREITLERRLEDVPRVRVSPDRLRQLSLNLLLNAADAIEGAGAIRVDVALQDSHVMLAVTDTGPGLSPEVVDHLFEPFVTTKPSGKGTGLGLAVCYTIVDQGGGTIRAVNEPGGGARFEVLLPFDGGDKEEPS